jgi:hypothetical protein
MGQIGTFMAEFVQNYGGAPLPLRPGHVYLYDSRRFPAKAKTQLGDMGGGFSTHTQGIMLLVDRAGNTLALAGALAHEILHFNSFHSEQIYQEDEETVLVATRRAGLATVRSKQKARPHALNRLNEALTEELARRFDDTYFHWIPELAEQFEFRQHVREVSDLSEGDPIIVTQQNPDKSWIAQITPRRIYYPERLLLKLLIEEIWSHHRERFATEEDVFTELARAYFTGRLLSFARLVTGIRGRGSFRRLAVDTEKPIESF